MYIHGLIHNNITGLTAEPDTNIIGEIVLQYENNTTSGKIFLCILLQNPSSSTSSLNTTSIDKTLNMILSDPTKTDQYITSIDLNLDLDIPKSQGCFTYKDSINTVIVLTQPISLSLSSTSLLISKLETTTNLFKINAPNNYQNSITSNNVPMDVGDDTTLNNNDEIYIDCKPTGPGISEISTYQLPLGSKLSTDLQNMDFMKTSVNFFVFIFGLVVIYFTVPMTYKMLVVDKINPLFTDNLLRKNRIRSVDILFSIAFISLAVSCFITGFTQDNQFQMVTNGLFLITFFGLSLSIIQFSKSTTSYMTTNGVSTTYEYGKDSFSIFEQLADFGNLIAGCFGYLLKKDTPAGRPLISVFAAEVIFFTILITTKYTSNLLDKGDFNKYSWQIGGLAIPIGIPIFIYLLSP
jgi:hypothetical protein